MEQTSHLIHLLDQKTINQIAAGEVVERPSSVVKELLENAIDAGANAITVEIKEGGISLIRITDNGSGIPKDQIPMAFLRHSTSKITEVEDLLTVHSLGFRGEALSSIAAVAQVELVTKTREELTGVRYFMEGGKEMGQEEIGCPDGTTFLVRNLFFNTPARRKFLKSPVTEGGYIMELVERMALSHPDISFKCMNNNQLKVHTTGNGQLKDAIYQIYGRQMAANLLCVEREQDAYRVQGFVAKPVVSRGNRNLMNYFINGRYIRSTLINKAIEEAYKPFSMTHRYPFTALHFTIPSDQIDVNVHPTKMEVRFHGEKEIYEFVYQAVSDALNEKELIPEVELASSKESEKQRNGHVAKEKAPEPFEVKRREEMNLPKPSFAPQKQEKQENVDEEPVGKQLQGIVSKFLKEERAAYPQEKPKQMELFEQPMLSKEAVKQHRIIGQVFGTYWIVEFSDKIYFIDQHAAHEKVLYERLMKSLKNQECFIQMVTPPIILSLSDREKETIEQYMDTFQKMGFEIEPFGGNDYQVCGVPTDLLGISEKEILMEWIDALTDENYKKTPEALLDKAATMACKAAVKGNQRLSVEEAKELIDELLTLEHPYHCPHGRPTIISMTEYELEKKFKRIV
ncbi:MAG: DNA mismatch repair endonuclease MutL [Clostridiales bacterium]|nr:DNA mismatch repair endonuclease MutL [Clostridiales bacterium]